jgi:hypothetical protein
LKSLFSPRDQLSPIPPSEYATRFLKFVRANIKPRDAPEPQLPSREEQEDHEILDKARQQAAMWDAAARKAKKERHVGGSRAFTPNEKSPTQIIPNATVSKAVDPEETMNEKPRRSLSVVPLVESPEEEKAEMIDNQTH